MSGCTVLITLDCGTKDFDALAAAAEVGIDTIVCDHHLPADTLPVTTALLNPKQEGCTYPFKELSGAGVAFKLLTALVNRIGLTMSSVYDHLDLLALSIGADLVDITGENRILAHHGMRKLRKTMRPGIRTMLQVANIERVPNTVRDISFTLGPRINAAGRVGHALKAVELLMASDDNTAYELAYELESMNQARRDLDEDMTEEALAQMAEQPAGRCCTVVCGEGWHRGVLGIVASRLVEARYRPTIVLSEENGLMMGSARSVQGVDIHEALEDCRSYLEQFGGHPMAAGLTLRSDQLHEFKNAIEEEHRVAGQRAHSSTEHLVPPGNRLERDDPRGVRGDGAFGAFRTGERRAGVHGQPPCRRVASAHRGSPRTSPEAHLAIGRLSPAAPRGDWIWDGRPLGRGAPDEGDGRGVHLGPKHVPGTDLPQHAHSGHPAECRLKIREG